MKKRSLILLPILLSGLVGCKGNSTMSQMDIDFKKAENLKYVKNYENKLGEELNFNEIYEFVEQAFFSGALTSKIIRANYNEFDTVENYNYIQTDKSYSVHTLYAPYGSTVNGTSKIKREYTNVPGKVFEGKRDFYAERYPNPDTQRLLYHEVTNGNHEIFDINVSSLPDRLKETHQEAFDLISGEWMGYCSFYKIEKGYAAYYEYHYKHDDEHDEYKTEYKEQTIYEFDNNYRLTKGSHFYERKSNRDYVNNIFLSKLKIDEYKHELYSVTYGARKDKSRLLASIQELYGKKHFGDSYFIYAPEVDDGYSRYVLAPQYIHMEGYSAFNSYREEEVMVSPEAELNILNDVYGEDGVMINVGSPKMKILSPKLLRYKADGNLYFKMNSINDAIFYQMDFKLNSKGKLSFVKGSVKVVDKLDIKDYFDNWDERHCYYW